MYLSLQKCITYPVTSCSLSDLLVSKLLVLIGERVIRFGIQELLMQTFRDNLRIPFVTVVLFLVLKPIRNGISDLLIVPMGPGFAKVPRNRLLFPCLPIPFS